MKIHLHFVRLLLLQQYASLRQELAGKIAYADLCDILSSDV